MVADISPATAARAEDASEGGKSRGPGGACSHKVDPVAKRARGRGQGERCPRDLHREYYILNSIPGLPVVVFEGNGSLVRCGERNY